MAKLTQDHAGKLSCDQQEKGYKSKLEDLGARCRAWRSAWRQRALVRRRSSALEDLLLDEMKSGNTRLKQQLDSLSTADAVCFVGCRWTPSVTSLCEGFMSLTLMTVAVWGHHQ